MVGTIVDVSLCKKLMVAVSVSQYNIEKRSASQLLLMVGSNPEIASQFLKTVECDTELPIL